MAMALRFQKQVEESGSVPIPEPPSEEELKKRQQALRTLQAQQAAAQRAAAQEEAKKRAEAARVAEQHADAFAKANRNDPCPCGSGKKFKKCHGQEG
jgi:preprotein translocase subunit SecA